MFVLAIIDLLEFETGDNVGRDLEHGRVSNGHARRTDRGNVLVGRNSVVRRRPSAQIPDSLMVKARSLFGEIGLFWVETILFIEPIGLPCSWW